MRARLDDARAREEEGRRAAADRVTGRNLDEAGGLVFSGMSPDGELPEIVERPDHPWFIGVQFHPELKSKPFACHPLFRDFIRAAKAHRAAREQAAEAEAVPARLRGEESA